MTEKSIEKPKKDTKPKTVFCWHCSRKLRANFHREYKHKDGHTYIVHAECAKELDRESKY